MWNKPDDIKLAHLPKLYETENIPLKDKVIYAHFFIGGSDWYACEYSPEERQFFGFVILNNDYEMAEWGYFDLDELLAIKMGFVEVDYDLHWKPCKAIEVPQIKQAQNWE